jgi:O-antigen/teichoic acid export membrane protein
MYKPKLPNMIVTTYLKLKRLIKSEGKLFASSGLLTFIRLGSGLLLLKLVATIGGNPAIAMYGQVHNVVSMANGIVASGAGDGVVKMTAQNQGDPSKISIIKSASILLVGLCSLVVILMTSIFWGALIDWASIGDITLLQITIYIFGALVASIGTLMISVANGFQLLDEVVKTSIVSIIVALFITGLFLLLLGDTVIWIIPAIYFGLIGICQIGFLIKKIRLPFHFLKFIDFNTIKHLGGYMIMIMGSFFMTPFALITIRGWLIQDYGADSAGDWESSRKLLELVTGLLTAYFAMVLLPKLAKISDTKNLRAKVIANAINVAILSAIILFFIYNFRYQVYYIIFSSDFIFSSELMSSRAIGEFLRGLTWIFGFILVVKAKIKLYLLISVLYMLVLLCTTWFLIEYYGMIGANYAYIASNTLMLFVSVIIFYYITIDSYVQANS